MWNAIKQLFRDPPRPDPMKPTDQAVSNAISDAKQRSIERQRTRQPVPRRGGASLRLDGMMNDVHRQWGRRGTR